MKFLFSIFLTLILFLNSFSNIFVFVVFKINQSEIAKTICVMREVKNNSCKGHCALKAQLKKQAENEQKHSNTLKEKVESIYTFTEIEYNFTPIVFSEINKNSSFYNHSKPISVSFAVFHPPIS